MKINGRTQETFPAPAGRASLALPDVDAATARGEGQALAPSVPLTALDVDRFLRIVSLAARVRRHYDLFQMLQDEVQYFVPHEVFICAWGDFLGPNLVLDVVSGLPGVRTGVIENCPIEDTLRNLHARWLAAGREAIQIEGDAFAALLGTDCDCALHRALRPMRFAVVHGCHDARDGSYSLYLACGTTSTRGAVGAEHFRFVVDSVLSQIEIAFRRVGALAPIGVPGASTADAAPGLGTLSAREQEILVRVSEGRTNLEIARILSISKFTVKNHVQRILRKLGVANRAEAVARCRPGSESRRLWRGRSSALSLAD